MSNLIRNYSNMLLNIESDFLYHIMGQNFRITQIPYFRLSKFNEANVGRRFQLKNGKIDLIRISLAELNDSNIKYIITFSLFFITI